MKLYDLTATFLDVERYIENAETPEELQMWQDAMNEVNTTLEEKVENMARLVKNIESDVDALSKEEKRLKAKRFSYEKKIEAIKQYLFNNLELIDKKKMAFPQFTVSIRDNPVSLNVLDLEKIPRKYFVKKDPELDKNTLKEALKMGTKVKGAELIRKQSLQIK